MRIFIGSSSERINEAKKIASWLEEIDVSVDLWTKIFMPGHNTIDDLIAEAQNVDAAIFVFAEDDKTWYRECVVNTVRDNVLFEYGLFCGSISKDNVIMAVVGNPQKATDIIGINHVSIEKEYKAQEEIKNWCLECKKRKNTKINPTYKVMNLSKALQYAVEKKARINTLRVFAISAFKSVQVLRLMNDSIKINHAKIMLREFKTHDDYYCESMANAINMACDSWHKMEELGSIKDLTLRFFDYHPDNGVYIFDKRILIMGNMVYNKKTKEYDFQNDVMVVENTSKEGRKIINNAINLFDVTFDNFE